MPSMTGQPSSGSRRVRSLPTRRTRLARSEAVYRPSHSRLMHADALGGSVGGHAVDQHQPDGGSGFAGRQHARGGQGFGELAWGHLGGSPDCIQRPVKLCGQRLHRLADIGRYSHVLVSAAVEIGEIDACADDGDNFVARVRVQDGQQALCSVLSGGHGGGLLCVARGHGSDQPILCVEPSDVGGRGAIVVDALDVVSGKGDVLIAVSIGLEDAILFGATVRDQEFCALAGDDGHGGCLLGVGGLGALNQPLGKMLPVRTYGDPHDAASCAQVADAMTSIRMIFDCHIPRFAGAVTDGLQGGGKGVLGFVAHLYLLIVAVSIRYRAAIISCLIAVSSMLAKIFQTIFLTMREAG